MAVFEGSICILLGGNLYFHLKGLAPLVKLRMKM